jgi:hypothetical protein
MSKQKRKSVYVEGCKRLDRAVAHRNMKKAGYTQLNKKDADGTSKFSKMWRDFVY